MSFVYICSMRVILTILYLLFSILSFSQQFNFLPVKTINELPSSQCNSIFLDSRDYFWICTDAGLAKFNGRNYKTFTIAEGLTDNTIFKVSEDKRGRLFYASSNSRLGYLKNDSAFVPPISDTLWKVLKKGRYFIYEVTDYENDQLLISTQAGFFLTDAETMSSFQFVPPPSAETSMWVKVRNKGVVGAHYLLDPEKYRTSIFLLDLELYGKKLRVQVPVGTGFSAMSLFKYLLLSDGRLLIGVTDRIYVFNIDGTYDTIPNPTRMTAFYEDRNGGVWISYLKNGVDYYPEGKILNEIPVHLLNVASITGFVMDREEGMWITSEGISYCPSLDVVIYPEIPDLNLKVSSLSVIGDHVVMNSLNNQFYLFTDKETYAQKKFDNKEVFANYSYLEHDNGVYSVGLRGTFLLDSNFKWKKTLALAGRKIGTMMYKVAAGPDKKIWGVNLNDLLYIKNDSIYVDQHLPSRGRSVAVDMENNAYVATNSGLLVRTVEGLIPVFEFNVKVTCLKCDLKGRIWACSDGHGVSVIERMKIIARYTTKEGMPSGICYDVDFDGKGNAWVATNNGLCRISPTGKVDVFKVQHGLPSNEIFKLAVKRDELYIGSHKGLCIVNLLNFDLKNIAPEIFIKRVYSDTLNILPGENLGYEQNNILFSVEGLAHRNPFGILYKYRLLGLDTVWKTNNTDEINFNNLNDGSYTFEVYAVNGDGVQSKIPAVFKFSIEPPYWEKWWFVALCIMALTSAMTMIILARSRVIRKREEAKTMLHKQIAEYQMSAIQAQMNPHFIFNAINSIQNYVLSSETQYAYDYLALFSKLIRQVLMNSQQNTISLRKELEMLGLYIDLEQRRFKNKFEYEIRCDENIFPDEIKIPVMLIQPFIENAIWHGLMNLGESRKGVLGIYISTVEEKLKIIVEDNGVGREHAAFLKNRPDHKSMAMLLTEKRMELMKAVNDKETRIIIHDLYDDTGTASGTRVEIYLPLNE